jgi:hypothetical protein
MRGGGDATNRGTRILQRRRRRRGRGNILLSIVEVKVIRVFTIVIHRG